MVHAPTTIFSCLQCHPSVEEPYHHLPDCLWRHWLGSFRFVGEELRQGLSIPVPLLEG